MGNPPPTQDECRGTFDNPQAPWLAYIEGSGLGTPNEERQEDSKEYSGCMMGIRTWPGSLNSFPVPTIFVVVPCLGSPMGGTTTINFGGMRANEQDLDYLLSLSGTDTQLTYNPGPSR